MKLILKQVAPQLDVTALGDEARRYVPGKPNKHALFALHTEDGQVLPCQVSTNLASVPGDLVHLTVVFAVNGDDLRVEGHGL
jgi:hypothetical protein